MKMAETRTRIILMIILGAFVLCGKLYYNPIYLLELNKKVKEMGLLPFIEMTDPIVFSGTKAERLAYAVDDEDTATISEIVRHEFDVLEVMDNYFQNTVFAQATLNEKYLSVCKLIELGADPSFKGENGIYSPLWIALNENKKVYCNLFLTKANMKNEDEMFDSFSQAIMRDNMLAIDFLCERNIHKLDTTGYLLYRAVIFGHYEGAIKLLEAESLYDDSIEYKGDYSRTPPKTLTEYLQNESHLSEEEQLYKLQFISMLEERGLYKKNEED